MSPKRMCLEPYCPNLVDDPKYRGRCKDHYLERERERNRRRRADPQKGRRVQVYHSKRWLILRRRVFEQPICADPACTRLATEVDHIVPMSQGGAEYERSNCQGLCAHHHALKSASEGQFPDAA